MTQTRQEAHDRLSEIIEEMNDLLTEAKYIQRDHLPSHDANCDAYLWAQLDNHVNGCNPYDSNLVDLAQEINPQGDCSECEEYAELEGGICEPCYRELNPNYDADEDDS